MRARVPADLDGQRADLILARVADISRAAARRLFVEGGAMVAGAAVEPRRRLSAGELLEWEPAPEASLEPEPVPFEVLYEDGFLAVIDKPAGIVVHPGAGRRRGTLAAGLLHRWPEVEGVGDEGRWGIVHRLDRETSGALVVALERRTHERLRRALSRREITREYVALVHGAEAAPSGTIDAPLGRDSRRPTRFRVDRGGRPARTHYSRTAAWAIPDLALLSVRLETGRTHQIRVHMASIGHPVAGDPMYGRGGDGMPGLLLHSARIRFVHPFAGTEVDVAAPVPARLTEVLAGLGPPDAGEVSVP